MRGISKRRVAVQLLGVLLYIAGALLFLVVILDAMSPEGGFSPEALTDESVAWIVVSMVLFASGGYLNWRARPEPEGAQFGSILPSHYGSERYTGSERGETRPNERDETWSGDGPQRDVGTGALSCPHCGTENERGYRFCGNCGKKVSG